MLWQSLLVNQNNLHISTRFYIFIFPCLVWTQVPLYSSLVRRARRKFRPCHQEQLGRILGSWLGEGR